MKLAIFFLVSLSCFAQKKIYTLADTPVKIDTLTGAMIYSEVVTVDSASALQLYNRAKQFLPIIFTSDGSVIQVDNKESGILTGRGKFTSKTGTGAAMLTGIAQVVYEMAIDIRLKDGRYRYEFSNIQISYPGMIARVDDSFRRYPKSARRYANQTFNEKQYEAFMSDKDPMNVLIKQLKTAMKSIDKKSDF